MDQKEVNGKGINAIIYTIIILIIIGTIIFLAYYAYQNIPREPQSLEQNNNLEDYSNIVTTTNQFYPNMKFNHKNIGYTIDGNCNEDKVDRMLQAFNELSNKVPQIVFVPLARNPDIEISCDENKGEKIDEKHFVAGEGGAKEIIQTERYNIITEGIILLYENKKIKSKYCDYPNVELHELLHVFGFEHSQDKRSIMYQFIESCDQILDQSIIDQLKELYSEENLPDLYFEFEDVTKKGRYLDFNLTIKNSGSVKSENVILTILDGESVIEEREMGEIEFGAGVTLYTTNLKLKSVKSNQATFHIDIENSINEIDKENNIVTYSLPIK